MEKHVVYAGTRNLYDGMVWSVKSLLCHTKVDHIWLLVEDDEFPYEMPDFVTTINVHDYIEQKFPAWGKNAKTHFTKMAMVRVCYTELLPDVERVLQLDVDTVIMDDISPLWDIDLDGKWFAATWEALSGYDPYRSGHYQNVGVCMFNLTQMRADDAQRQLVELLNTKRMNCIEQDALNILGQKRGLAADMPMRFNENRACGYTDDPAIVHYVGYMDWTTNPNLARREYLKLYRDLPWSEVTYA